MRKWYESGILKTVLLILAVVATTVGFMSFTVIMNCAGTFSVEDFYSTEGKAYEDTEGFEELLSIAVENSLDEESIMENIETDGKYDPKKLVDIMEYYEQGDISGENVSGLAYHMEDLLAWYKAIGDDVWNYKNNNIIVCQKPDGTYYYYYNGEFEKLLEEGELRLEVDEDYSTSAFLNELDNGYYNGANQFAGTLLIKNKDGETLYTDCWAFTESLDEMAAPVGAENILEVVNSKAELNGRLSEVYTYLESVLTILYENKNTYDEAVNGTFSEGNTNYMYYLLNHDTEKVYTNNSEYSKETDPDKVIEEIKGQDGLRYIVVKPKLKDFESNFDVSAGTWKENLSWLSAAGDNCTFVTAVDTTYPIHDVFYEAAEQYNKFAPYYGSSIAAIVFCIILLIICTVWLTVVTGSRNENGEVRLHIFDKIKTEIAATIVIGTWVLLTAVVSETLYVSGGNYYSLGGYNYYSGYYYDMTGVIMLGLYGMLSAILFFVGYLSVIRRIKAGTLWKNSLCRICLKIMWKICKLFGEFWRKRNVIWKMALIILGFCFVHWMAFGIGEFFYFLAVVLEIAAALWLLWEAVIKQRIRKGIQNISAGDVTYQISTDKMIGVNKEIAENVNHIGDGLSQAVDNMMKSERMKTDLITNVSHDIKTPLTSIINYVDLLKRENIQDPKIQGYIQILEEKSQRLKILTEDVVEASKVSSGNILLEYMNVNFVEMLNQTAGEFSEKFEAKKLNLLLNVPEEPVIIRVDNRRMWRILENIFNNAAKYSMPGTRVYADLKKDKGKMLFSLKNISDHPLNIEANELTERFIRGDISRSTEGSGLGLSIAKNLTELQGGKLELYLDGDLFKVTIEFPINNVNK